MYLALVLLFKYLYVLLCLYVQRLQHAEEEKATLEKKFMQNLEDLKESHVAEMKHLSEQYEKETQARERNHQSVVETMKAEVCVYVCLVCKYTCSEKY